MKIFVVTHKKINNEFPKDYYIYQVNTLNNGKIYEINDANYSDNISLKNPFYCELTCAYSIWKNEKSDIVGLVHYRRVFTKNKFISSKKNYLNSKDVYKQLEKHDFIATKLYKSGLTVKELLLVNVRNKDYELLRNTINRIFPEYIETFDFVMSGHKSYLLNMFICRKELFDEYYSWLFVILFEMEKKVNMEGYSIQEKRLYGFLAERLFTVYVIKNNLKVKSYPVEIIGESRIKTIWNKTLKILGFKKD